VSFQTLNDINRKIRPESLTAFNDGKLVVYFKVGILAASCIESLVFTSSGPLWRQALSAGKTARQLLLPISVGLFLTGVALCEFVALPKA
jgi:hypothetical protein